MPYATTFPEIPTKEEVSQRDSLISLLTTQAGYNREGLKSVELESKVDITPRLFCINYDLEIGEKLPLPEPYSRDKLLETSLAIHSIYGFISKDRKNCSHAFTKVERENKTKIKIKGISKFIERNNIFLLEREEDHLQNLTPLEINKYISELARKSNLPLEYLGSFSKKSKETFIFNPTSGRIFVMSVNFCEDHSLMRSKLYQLEVEYYGQINGFVSLKEAHEEMFILVEGILKKFPLKYHARSSKFTKFDWVLNSFKNIK